MDILKYIKATSSARPSEKPKSTVQPSPTLEKRDDITPIESRLIPMRARVGRPAQVTSLSSHSSIPGPASLLPNSPTKDIIYGSEKLTESIKVYAAMKRNKIYAKDCSYQHLEKILKENTAGFSQEEYLKALLCHDIPDSVRPFNLFFRLMQANYHVSLMIRDIWLDWLSQPTDPVYKSLLSQVIRIKDPSSKKSLLEWSGNTDIPKARNIKYWIEKVLPDETFKNLPEESETASSMTSVPHHQINPRKRRRNHHQIGLRDEQKKHQKKSMLPVTLPAYLPEDYGCSPTHGHQPTKETPELLPQNPENPGSATTSFTSENIDNVLNFIPYWQKGNLQKHKSISYQKKWVCCKVTGCNEKFTDKLNLKKHIMNRHKNPSLKLIEKIEQKKSMLPVTLPAYLPEDYGCSPTHGHQPTKETPELLPQNPENPGSATTSFTSENIDNVLNFIPYWQKGNLKKHKSISYQKKWVCCKVTGCNEKFTDKLNLKKHIMNRHKNPSLKLIEKIEQKKSMLPVKLPAYLPEDYKWSPPHGHQPAEETSELLPQNPENPGSAPTSFTSENIVNVLNFIPFSQTSPVTQVSQSVTEPAVLADTETNSQERKLAQTLTISSSHRQDRFHCDFTGCHKHFKHKQGLSRHKKIHTNEKFRCDAQGCNKEFRQKKYLETHQSNSHQKKRFCCNVTGCDRQFTVKWNLKKHQMNKHKNPDSLSTQTSSSRPINQNSAPASTVGTIIEPAIPVICITSFEEDRHSQVFPAIPAEHSVHDFLTVSDAKALPITLNDPHSGTGMGTRRFLLTLFGNGSKISSKSANYRMAKS